ncbi:MAG: DUF4058 family protein [Chloroflexaceae bacterium]|nr:DUF4058 family protein [Chloroflexaceae bacterium]
MPSPFPGMNPYLEGNEWTSVHTALALALARQLAPLLSPRYIVRPEQRFIAESMQDIAIVSRTLYPDVLIAARDEAVGTAAVAMPSTAPLQLATVIPDEEPQITLEIRDAAHRVLVTAIEVLSLSNKRSEGYGEYVEKRTRILRSRVHLLEIDLLRRGVRVPMREALPDAPYFVLLSRAERRPLTEVWPVALHDRLPRIPVPLLPGDADVPLDLQVALDTVYDELRYDLSIDYTQPPDVPLDGDDARWVAKLVQP